jgi:Methyltransferase domain
MRERDYFALAAYRPGARRDGEVLEDYVQELAQLYEMPADVIRPRFERFLDVYYRRVDPGTAEEWAQLQTGDLEHSFIRISKPYRFRESEMVPEALRVIQRSLRSGAARSSLLEFGGGFGNDAIVYARHGFEAHYADLVSLRNTDVVVRRFAVRDLEISVHDAGALPDRRFDVITAMDVLEHIYDVEEAIAQLASRIPRGGLLCCVNAFGAITYDGDHHDKNRVYLDLFGELMSAAGFEEVEANPPLAAYRRVREPEREVDAELARIRPLIYAATCRRARECCDLLLHSIPNSRDVAWERLPLGSAAASDHRSASAASRWESLRGRAYAAAAQRAPRALKRAVWRRRIARTTAELTHTGDPARTLGALADWVSVLRIAEYRLSSLVPGRANGQRC